MVKLPIEWLLVVCVLLGAVPAKAISVEGELRSRSRIEGLGIGSYSANGKLEVQYFGGIDNTESIHVPGLAAVYDIDPSSQVIFGALSEHPADISARDQLMRPNFALFSLEGEGPAPVGLRVWPRSGSVSVRGKRLAALMVDSRSRTVRLKYGDFAWTSVHTIYSLDLGDDPEHLTVVNYIDEHFDWSPEGRFLVYSLGGTVRIFDTQTQSSRSIASGRDPSWSPDGKFIAYRSLEHTLVIYEVRERVSRSLTRDVDVEGIPRWTSDSRLILFTRFIQRHGALDPLGNGATAFMALRVSDGASAVALVPGNGTDNRRFFWVRTKRRDH